MSGGSAELRVAGKADGYALSGEGQVVELFNEFLGYLSDRNYSLIPAVRDVRARAPETAPAS